MTELKFNGAATVTGFPREEAFGFEIAGDVLVIKAGKNVFLRIEKDPVAVEVVEAAPKKARAPRTAITGPADPVVLQAVDTQSLIPSTHSTEPTYPQRTGAPAGVTETGEEIGTEKKRKPRGPNVTIDENAIVSINPLVPNPYSKLRGKYYETLKTAAGRTVGWWKTTKMVMDLEGVPVNMLKTFLADGNVKLLPAAVQADQVQPILPNQSAPAGQQPSVAGALWTPGGNAPPAQAGGATFL